MSNVHLRTWLSCVALASCTILSAGLALADGFRNPPEGAAVIGRGGVRMTLVDDASAVTHNPANLADLKERQALVSATIGYAETTFTSPAGASEDSREPWSILPAVYAAMPVADGRYTIGLGLHVPYGQSTDWRRDGMFMFVAPYSAEMSTLDLSPAVATRLADNLAVGVGVDLMWSELQFKQLFPSLAPPAGPPGPPMTLDFEGDGFGLGAHVGVSWDVCEGHRLAIGYRSPVSVDYDGDFRMGPAPGALPPPLTAASDFETEIEFPSVVAVGYGVQLGERLQLEANVEWVEHSRNESLDLDIGNNNPLLLAARGTTSLPQDWDDTWTFGIGGDLELNDEWTLRGGYTYLPTPIPDSTIAPSLAEEDKHVIGIGVGFAADGHRADLAYAYNHADERRVDDPANPINGTYDIEQHLLVASYALLF